MKQTTTAQWVFCALVAGLAIAAATAAVYAGSAEQLEAMLRATARWSFLWFWPAYAGGALATLFGARFQTLAERRRDFGLAFASAHLAHVAVVALYLSVKFPKPFPVSFVFFLGGIFWVYLLALLSFRQFAAPLDPKIRHALRTIGAEYIAFAFLFDFIKHPFLQSGLKDFLIYLPFVTLAVGGPILRLAAKGKRMASVRRLAA